MKWPTEPIRKVAPAEASLIRFSPTDVVWHLTLDQIESNTGYIINKKTALASEAGTSTYVFDEGNVLYSKLRPYLNKVVCPTEPGIATTELVPLRPRPEVLDRRFLTYYLRSRHFLAFANTAVAGVKMPRLIMDKFWKHHIPLPPPSEQRRIVEILDQADALRKKRAEADAKAARILPALFYKMFGDPATNPKGWPLVSGKEMFAKIGYGVGSPPPFADKGGIPFLRAGNIKPTGIKRDKLVFFDPKHESSIARSRVNKGDVIIVRRGAYTGDCAVIPEEFDGAYVGYDLICRPNEKTNPHWFAATWNYPTIWQRIENIRKRAAQQGLNKDQIASFTLPRPPKDRQDEFACKVQSLSVLNSAREKCGNELNKLFEVLLHRAFTGDLTAKWRKAHMKELLEEMEQQAKALETPISEDRPATIRIKHNKRRAKG